MFAKLKVCPLCRRAARLMLHEYATFLALAIFKCDITDRSICRLIISKAKWLYRRLSYCESGLKHAIFSHSLAKDHGIATGKFCAVAFLHQEYTWCV